ncbi:MAG: 5'/3'-nucleotidase SurE, partial [Anaerolineales bacterium]|nr:5'/3'-nucleotidase SurE [Anaerolineales bacterium]
ADVDVLKVEVPCDATLETPWQITRLSRAKYYIPVKPERTRLDEPASVGYTVAEDSKEFEPDSDTYALRVLRRVAVTPLSIDITSRVNLDEFERALRTIEKE